MKNISVAKAIAIAAIKLRWPDNGDFNNFFMNGDPVREQVYDKKVVT